MFRAVIVPLDGSASAEVAVPYAVDQASRQRATLVLVRVIPRPELLPTLLPRGGPMPRVPIWPADGLAAEERQAGAYLDGVARRFRLVIGSETVVAVGDPFLRLVAEIQRRPAPIVVVSATSVAKPVTPAEGHLVRRILLAGVAPVLAVREQAAVDADVSVGFPADWTHRPGQPAERTGQANRRDTVRIEPGTRIEAIVEATELGV
jgi:nucleotide-binding universal stress UspA family protein